MGHSILLLMYTNGSKNGSVIILCVGVCVRACGWVCAWVCACVRACLCACVRVVGTYVLSDVIIIGLNGNRVAIPSSRRINTTQ